MTLVSSYWTVKLTVYRVLFSIASTVNCVRLSFQGISLTQSRDDDARTGRGTDQEITRFQWSCMYSIRYIWILKVFPLNVHGNVLHDIRKWRLSRTIEVLRFQLGQALEDCLFHPTQSQETDNTLLQTNFFLNLIFWRNSKLERVNWSILTYNTPI